MAPRTITNPAPQTAAARAALQAFHCDLCGKGYARQNEFAAHEASYEHNHNQRRADLRRMNTQMSSAVGSGGGGAGGGGRRGSSGENGIIKIQLGAGGEGKKKKEGGGGAGFKKAGFKSAFAPVGPVKGDDEVEMKDAAPELAAAHSRGNGEVDSDDDDDNDYELYDPRHPTGCSAMCASRA